MKTALGRNDPCSCGSGKKHKKCCGAVPLKPASAQPFALLERGNELMKLGLMDGALWNYREAIRLDPCFVPAYLNLGAALIHTGKHADAAETLRHALTINPNSHQAYHGLCACLQVLGQIDGAVDAARKGLALAPDDAKLHSALIFAMDLSPKYALYDLQAERKLWNELHAKPFHVEWKPHTNTWHEDRPLRIGYVSADFREHSAMRAAMPMLTLYDRNRFSVYCYSNLFTEDEETLKIRKAVTKFVHIDALSDEKVVEMIRADRIDILVDLSGHSGGNRLLVFARKPAPVQVTAWGYATGTGMDAIDAFFADCITVPTNERAMYSEQVRYLPSIAPYLPLRDFPPVAEAPWPRNKCVTFGSFNRLAKITDETLDLWAKIQKRMPSSKMLFKVHDLTDAKSTEQFALRLDRAKFDLSRILIYGRSTWLDHLARYADVDVSLDPFPHGGGMTTVESLMMGVPVLTRRGQTIVSRLSASFLESAGERARVAESDEEYVHKAVTVLPFSTEERRRLREKCLASPFGDLERYVRAVETEYLSLWHDWRSKQMAGSQGPCFFR